MLIERLKRMFNGFASSTDAFFSRATGTPSGPAAELQDSSLITSTINLSFTDIDERQFVWGAGLKKEAGSLIA